MLKVIMNFIVTVAFSQKFDRLNYRQETVADNKFTTVFGFFCRHGS